MLTTLNEHQKHHAALGLTPIKAVVEAWPSTFPQVYCSPIAGEADLTESVPIGSLDHMGSGFLMPKSGGVISEIGFIAQGNTGAGDIRDVRYNIVSLTKGNSSVSGQVGLKVAENLLTGLTTVANNYNGVVSVTGLNLVVPSQFMVFWKAGPTNDINCQLMKSAGPIPGVLGSLQGSTLLSTVAYSLQDIDLGAAPRIIAVDEEIRISNFAGGAMYIKWKGDQ